MSIKSSVSGLSCRAARETDEQIYAIAEQLLNGEPPINVNDRNRKSVIIALITLRHEAESIKEFLRADRAADIIKTLSKQQPIPQIRRKFTSPTQSISHSKKSFNQNSPSEMSKSCNSSPVRKSPKNKQMNNVNQIKKDSESFQNDSIRIDLQQSDEIQNPNNSFSDITPSIQSDLLCSDEAMSEFSRSVNSCSEKKSIRFISNEDYQKMSRIIDEILKHKREINDELMEEEVRRKLVLALRIRREQAKTLCMYFEVRNLDEIAKALKPKKVDPRVNTNRLRELEARIEVFNNRISVLCENRDKEINQLTIQWQQELDDFECNMMTEERNFIESLPSVDDPSFYHCSSHLIEMRLAEKKYVDGFDYDSAVIMHKKADEREEEEALKTKLEIIEVKNRRKEKFLQDREKARDIFKAKWELKFNIAKEKYEKYIYKIEIAKKQAVREADEYRKKVRAGQL